MTEQPGPKAKPTLDNFRELTEPAGLAPAPWHIAPRPPGGTRVVDANGAPVADTAHPAINHFIAAAPTHLADLITALEQIERVREVHKVGWIGVINVCTNCRMGDDYYTYPCPTIRILDGNE